MATLTLTVNGQEKKISTDPDRPLLEVLREDLQLTGTRYGCGEGQCGVCTVLLDGKRTFSCKTAVSRANGKTVQTIEGLAKGDPPALHPVQQAFLDESAFQCAYCTSGMIMAAVALLNDNPKPTDAQVIAGMNKNVCRCCSYTIILKAVKRAAGAL
jgi:aerobic-type carbon monoxide dehydrogenase small subunit (CoxS/CutS family)